MKIDLNNYFLTAAITFIIIPLSICSSNKTKYTAKQERDAIEKKLIEGYMSVYIKMHGKESLKNDKFIKEKAGFEDFIVYQKVDDKFISTYDVLRETLYPTQKRIESSPSTTSQTPTELPKKNKKMSYEEEAPAKETSWLDKLSFWKFCFCR